MSYIWSTSRRRANARALSWSNTACYGCESSRCWSLVPGWVSLQAVSNTTRVFHDFIHEKLIGNEGRVRCCTEGCERRKDKGTHSYFEKKNSGGWKWDASERTLTKIWFYTTETFLDPNCNLKYKIIFLIPILDLLLLLVPEVAYNLSTVVRSGPTSSGLGHLGQLVNNKHYKH